MMEIQLERILTVCIVNFVLTFVQSHNQMIDQVVFSDAKSEIRENFQNLLNSVGKSDTKKSKIYLGILKHDLAREQQTFDAMKEELQIAHNRNIYKKIHFFKGSNTHEKVVANKRETNENNHNTGSEDERDLATLERLFQKKYSSDPGYNEWKELRDANTTTLSRVCSKYVFMISSATNMTARGTKSFRDRYTFCNRTEPVFELDTLTCNITLIGRTGELKGKQKFYLTDGDEPNSAFKFALIQQGIFLTRKVTKVWA